MSEGLTCYGTGPSCGPLSAQLFNLATTLSNTGDETTMPSELYELEVPVRFNC